MTTGATEPDDRQRLTRWLNEARRGNREAFKHLCDADSWHRWLIAITALLPPQLRPKVDPEDVRDDRRHRFSSRRVPRVALMTVRLDGQYETPDQLAAEAVSYALTAHHLAARGRVSP